MGRPSTVIVAGVATLAPGGVGRVRWAADDDSNGRGGVLLP
jgi:hypothetical protein